MGDLLGLKYKERTALEAVIATSRDAKQLQRARALLWLVGQLKTGLLGNVWRMLRVAGGHGPHGESLTPSLTR